MTHDFDEGQDLGQDLGAFPLQFILGREKQIARLPRRTDFGHGHYMSILVRRTNGLSVIIHGCSVLPLGLQRLTE